MINLSYPLSLPTEQVPQSVAAIGFFDGIHKGHQSVISRAVQVAQQKNMESAVITFHPHPSAVLKQPQQKVKYITPLHEKQEILKKLKVDRMYVIDFNQKLSLLTPEQFINTYIKQLNVAHLIAGFDFTYGHKGAGNMENLADLANDHFTFEVIDKIEMDNEKVSSTKIRQLLSEGNIDETTRLLGRHLTVDGQVIQGDKRGRTIGFPTANLAVNDDYLLPKIGVYAVEVLHDGNTYLGMANLGVVPTFRKEGSQLSLEVHILDFDQTIYDEKVTIKWHQFLRPEKKFSGIDELVEQLKFDEKQVRQYFARKK